MDIGQFGKWLFFAGIVVAVLGLLVWLGPRLGFPFGRLPGDVTISRDGYSFHFPIVTSIVISIVLTIILNVILRLFNR